MSNENMTKKQNRVILYVLGGIILLLIVLLILAFVLKWGKGKDTPIEEETTTEFETETDETETTPSIGGGDVSDDTLIDVFLQEPDVKLLSGDSTNLWEALGFETGTVNAISDETIAKISADGTIEGLRYGDVEVTYTITDSVGNPMEMTANVHIGSGKIYVKVSEYSVSMEVGTVKPITVTVTDDRGDDISELVEIVWEVLDESIVGVSNGELSAYAIGQTAMQLTVVTVEEKIGIGVPVSITAEHEEEESIPHNHVFNQVGTTEASCTKGGTVKYTCTCGAAITETVDLLGHNYEVTKKTNATCTAEGTTTYTCTRCKDSYTEKTSAALGHDHRQTASTPATCSAAGTVTYTCSRCKDSYTTQGAAQLKHSYSLVSATAATCNAAGTKTYKCDRCGDSYTTEGDAKLSHSYTLVSNVAPTCEADGQKTYKCDHCGNSYSETVARTHGHEYEETSRTAAKCETAGTIYSKCKYCGKDKTETIPSTGHHWIQDTSYYMDPGDIQYGKHRFICDNPGCSQELIELHDKEPCSYNSHGDAEQWRCKKCNWVSTIQ